MKDRRATLYSKKVINPKPEVTITSFDVLPGVNDRGQPENRAVPALLAVTIGKVQQ